MFFESKSLLDFMTNPPFCGFFSQKVVLRKDVLNNCEFLSKSGILTIVLIEENVIKLKVDLLFNYFKIYLYKYIINHKNGFCQFSQIFLSTAK